MALGGIADGRAISRTVASVFDPKHNSLNAIRLLLAVAVIVSHSWPVGGYGTDPRIGDLNLGTWAVAGFFAISGYLITMSRVRSETFGSFLWKRVLRIYPAFIVALLVVGFALAPLSALLSGDGYSLGSAISYVGKNLSLVIFQGDVRSTLTSTPIPFAWNGSLWTLKWEFLCYLAIGIVLSLTPRRAQGAVVLGAFGVCTVGTALDQFTSLSFGYNGGQLLELGAFFTAGSLIYLFGYRITLSGLGALIALVVLFTIAFLGCAAAFAGLPLAYVILWASMKLPLASIGSKNDISYGMYIYAFPIQQTLAVIFPGQALPVSLYVILAIVATVPFALASWRLVERPAISLRKYSRRTARPSPGG